MSVHSQDSDNEELGAIGGKKPISRQISPFSRPSSVVLMESLLKQQQEYMQQQQRELMHNINSRMDTIKDQSDTTNSNLDGISIHSFIHCRHLYSASSSGATQKRSQPQRG